MTKPVLYHTPVSMFDIGDSVSGNILTTSAYDADGDTLSVVRVDGGYVASSGPSKGANTFVGNYGTLTIHQDGSYTYTPFDGLDLKPGQSDVDSFNIKIADGAGSTAQTAANVLTFTINGTVNQAPHAIDHSYTTDSSGVASGNLLTGATDPNHDTLHVGSIIADDGTQNYHITGLGTVTIQGVYGTLTVNDDGTFSYAVNHSDPDTIAAGGHGVEEFAYKVHDGQNSEPGHNTDYALFDITF